MIQKSDLEISEGGLQDMSVTTDPNISSAVHDEEHFCKLILYKEIKDSRVRIWDVIILIPNLLFLLFIAVRFNRARLKLRATSSPIFLAFYGLVICNVVISVIRCIVSMSVNAAAMVGGNADKVLWVTVRFFLLSTEMSVVIFGLAFGHLDSRSSIRRVLLATSFIALAFTITQGTLELVLPDDTFHIPSRDFYVFGHGGMMFWFCSSIVFTTIYLFILILPWTRLRERLALPTRKSFYIYTGLLAVLDLSQSIGAGLLNYTQNLSGLCVVDLTALIYLTLFTPLVYHTFLAEFFGVSQPSIMFSYKAQVDDAMDEDTVSLPHQQSFSSLKTDSDYIYQVHTPCFHAPFFDSQGSSKPSGSKQHTSLYSLTSQKATRFPRAGGSQTTLSCVRPTDSQKSAPDLSFENPVWNSSSRAKHTDGGSMSNLLLSLKSHDDSDSRMTSQEAPSKRFRHRDPSRSNGTSPKLESKLRNILDREGQTSASKESRVDKGSAKLSMETEAKGLGEYLRCLTNPDNPERPKGTAGSHDDLEAQTVDLLSNPSHYSPDSSPTRSEAL